MLNTPEIPDLVPHFIQGHHLNDQGLLSLKTHVIALDGSRYMVSSVQLGKGSETIEILAFSESGRGPAVPEYTRRYTCPEVAGRVHSTICNSIMEWDPRIERPLLVVHCSNGATLRVNLHKKRPKTVSGVMHTELDENAVELWKRVLGVDPGEV